MRLYLAAIALPIESLHDVASTSADADGRCDYIQFDMSLKWQTLDVDI